MKINKTIGFLVLNFIALNPTFEQTTKDLLNLVVQDIASGESKIELQRMMSNINLGQLVSVCSFLPGYFSE